MIYFDNAATGLLKPPEVAQAVFNAVQTLGNPSRGSYDSSLNAARLVYEAREACASLFDVPDPLQVAFTSGVTESLNIAIQGLFAPGDHVITTSLEHNSVLRPLYRMAEQGLNLTVIPCNEKGQLDYAQIEKNINPATKGIVCTHASNVTGNLVDIEIIGGICCKHQLYFILDTAQGAGIFDISMDRHNISALCFTGHKALMGPQGIGGICLNKDTVPRQFKVGGSGIHSFDKTHPQKMPDLLEAGTLNCPGIAGLLEGLRFIRKTGIAAIRAHEQQLLKQFYEGICNIPNVLIYGDFEQPERAPVITLNIEGISASDLCTALYEDYQIATRTGAHCAPLMHKAMGTEKTGAVRFSFSYFNTIEEINTGIDAIRKYARAV